MKTAEIAAHVADVLNLLADGLSLRGAHGAAFLLHGIALLIRAGVWLLL